MSKTPLEYAQELQTIINELHNENQQLNKELSKWDSARCDIEHFIEFGNFNASQGYRYAKALKEIMKQRRLVKNKMEKMQFLHKYNNQSTRDILGAIVQKIENKEIVADSRTYTARILDEITLEEKGE